MRPIAISVACIVLVGVSACEDERSCTTELRTAVLVHVTGDLDQIERVTADNGRGEQECNNWSAEADSGATGRWTFSCFEQGAGTYTIRVHLEDETLTETVEVSGNECHVDYPPRELEIEWAIID
jgi:hypothetical protein